ncbi:hypothetical protein IP90_02601 [Luteimonas cucumeris]|uniref:Sugar transporter n=1 Tax=Luteimonas cucumeris TaxID=985012 RepID=A0A562KZY0_9GAMM|nr:hypothetical protein [Luteimonas cucumeris]TWI00979.1 hypothetical protein IP90_02601 [Luteimonas cucumeris]
MNAPAVKRPAWFWIVAALALLWNIIGIAMAWMQYSMTPEQLAQLPEPQRILHEAMPGWLWAVDFVAVIAGTLGSLLLLMGKRLALPMFWISLVAVVVLFGYCLFPGGMIEVLGAAQALPMPILVTTIAALLVWFARRSIARGWIA